MVNRLAVRGEMHLAALLGAVAEREVHDLAVHGKLNILQNDEGTGNGRDSSVVEAWLYPILFRFSGLYARLRHLLGD